MFACFGVFKRVAAAVAATSRAREVVSAADAAGHRAAAEEQEAASAAQTADQVKPPNPEKFPSCVKKHQKMENVLKILI